MRAKTPKQIGYKRLDGFQLPGFVERFLDSNAVVLGAMAVVLAVGGARVEQNLIGGSDLPVAPPTAAGKLLLHSTNNNGYEEAAGSGSISLAIPCDIVKEGNSKFTVARGSTYFVNPNMGAELTLTPGAVDPVDVYQNVINKYGRNVSNDNIDEAQVEIQGNGINMTEYTEPGLSPPPYGSVVTHHYDLENGNQAIGYYDMMEYAMEYSGGKFIVAVSCDLPSADNQVYLMNHPSALNK